MIIYTLKNTNMITIKVYKHDYAPNTALATLKIVLRWQACNSAF